MQPGEPKDHLDWIFHIDSKDGLIHGEVFSIRICDLNVDKVVLINSKKVFNQGFQVWKNFVVAQNPILPHEVLQNQVSRWPTVNYSLDFKYDEANKNVNWNENML